MSHASAAADSDPFAFLSQSHWKLEFLEKMKERLSFPKLPEFVVVCLLKLIAQVDQSQFFMGDWHYAERKSETDRLLSLALFCVETLTSMIQNGATGEPNRFLLILLQAYAGIESCSGSDEEKAEILRKWRDIFQSTYDGMVHSSDSDRKDWDIHIRNLSNFFGREIPSNPFQEANPKDAFWLIDLALLLSQDGFAIAKMAEVHSWEALQAAMNAYKQTRPATDFLQHFQAIIEKTGHKRAGGSDDDDNDSSDDDDDDGSKYFRAQMHALLSQFIRQHPS